LITSFLLAARKQFEYAHAVVNSVAGPFFQRLKAFYPPQVIAKSIYIWEKRPLSSISA